MKKTVANMAFCMLAAVSALGVVGCSDSGPEPTTARVQQEGQSAQERAMQGMPESARQQYQQQQN